MKSIYYLILLFLASCSYNKKLNKEVGSGKDYYYITKIKTIGNWYVIYATKGDSTYKIVSKIQQNQPKSCRVRKGRYYAIELHWILEKESPKVSNYADVACYNYDPRTTICIEPEKGIYKLYNTPDIKGLCYLKE